MWERAIATTMTNKSYQEARSSRRGAPRFALQSGGACGLTLACEVIGHALGYSIAASVRAPRFTCPRVANLRRYIGMRSVVAAKPGQGMIAVTRMTSMLRRAGKDMRGEKTRVIRWVVAP